MQKRRRMFSFFPKKFKAHYKAGERVPSSGIYECSLCTNYAAFKKGETFSQCDDCLKEGRENPNSWYITNEVIHFMSKNLNLEFERISGFHLKLADRISAFAGSMGFVYFHTIWFAFWILANLGHFGPEYMFDPYPFGLLTMIVSLEAIYLATFIMISQNISGQRSELRAELDYQVNLSTEKEVAEILATVKEIKEEQSFVKNLQEELLKRRAVQRAQYAAARRRKKTPEFEQEEMLLKEAGIDIIQDAPHEPALGDNGNGQESREHEQNGREESQL